MVLDFALSPVHTTIGGSKQHLIDMYIVRIRVIYKVPLSPTVKIVNKQDAVNRHMHQYARAEIFAIEIDQ